MSISDILCGVLRRIVESEGVLQASYNVSLGGNAWPDSGCLLLAALLRKTRRRANGHREMESCTLSRKNVREPFARGQREVESCTLSRDECSRVACRTGEGCSQTHCATAGINLTVTIPKYLTTDSPPCPEIQSWNAHAVHSPNKRSIRFNDQLATLILWGEGPIICS